MTTFVVEPDEVLPVEVALRPFDLLGTPILVGMHTDVCNWREVGPRVGGAGSKVVEDDHVCGQRTLPRAPRPLAAAGA